MLRWIDELNGVKNINGDVQEIKARIRGARRAEQSRSTRALISKLYDELDNLQFQKDYMCLIIDREKDYRVACGGFIINGTKYVRLLGTNGGIKNSTIVFVNEQLADELRRRINNDRDETIPLVTAKLEAYKALACSASNVVSFPDGLLVVDDVETEFLSDVIYMTDEDVDEPSVEYKSGSQIKIDATDGFGIMLPSLAKKWSNDLGIDYMTSGVNTRFAWEKGMVYTFDFIEFAESVAGTYFVKDAWGNMVDVRTVELILTTSMVKLWDSYKDCDDYLSKSISNGYTFCVTKTCPDKLENERRLNYQFIQPFPLNDDDIEELISPTMNEIKDVLGGDWRKSVLFLRGGGINSDNVDKMENDFIKGIMIDQRLTDDPFVQTCIYQQIKNRIDEAKVGVLKVHGNYSMVSGDPYILCQGMFGMETTGLLRSGEIFNKYWADCGSKELVCFRAPMSCYNNIRKVVPVRREDAMYWYRYMNTCTVLNSWDTSMIALNGCDFDGDLVMLTDNPVLVRNLDEAPALMCAQRKAEKKISTEEDFVESNIASFGNEIGQTTNWITSMYEVRESFEKGSREYDELTYRIMSGQLYQQNAIDKAKGIVCKPMPRSWHDKYAASNHDDSEFYLSIVADKKPYFMKYIYPSLSKQYNTYIKNTNKNSLREFKMTVDELMQLEADEMTDRQKEFLKFYEIKMPVGTNECVMNKICKRFEEEFDGHIKKSSAHNWFDYTILKSGKNYPQSQFYAIKSLYDSYNTRIKNYSVFSDYERIDKAVAREELVLMNSEFRKECSKVCSDESVLCDIILDMCYKRKATKRFAWAMCGRQIINNLLVLNGMTISFPVQDDSGDIEYGGNKFSVDKKVVDYSFDSVE